MNRQIHKLKNSAKLRIKRRRAYGVKVAQRYYDAMQSTANDKLQQYLNNRKYEGGVNLDWGMGKGSSEQRKSQVEIIVDNLFNELTTKK